MNLEKFGLFLTLNFIGLVVVTAQGLNVFLDPCWGKSCHDYARCEVRNNSQAVCTCLQNCSTGGRAVCGTDWKTYNNLCDLMSKSCASNSWTRLRYFGECKAGSCSRDRWLYLQCPFYSECTLYYGLPRCSCPHVTCSSHNKPVCGTDGKTYPNTCFLRKAACRTKRWLRIRSMGHCRPDPCNSVDCCCGSVCRVDQTNQATCQCNFTCTKRYDPVCGSDGKTYNNPCNLRSAACTQQNPKLVMANRGPCATPVPPTTISPCALVSCRYYATCRVVGGIAMCVCPDICPRVSDPVCGSNGITYDNVCELRKAICKIQSTISLAKRGACATTAPPTQSPCATAKCGKYAKCEVVAGKAKCVCPSLCITTRAPVCGSDGITYDHQCDLERTSCLKGGNITLAKMGACASPCDLVECCCGSICKVQNNTAKCLCTFVCTNEYEPVCGSDGRTYHNECKMRLAACKTRNSNLKEVSRGRCQREPPPTPSPCGLIKCIYHSTCKVVSGFAMCVCPTLCPNARDPVCGSDGVTYDNECILKRTACTNMKSTTVAKKGSCVPTKILPTVSPCVNKICSFYATCRVVAGQATCVCPTECRSVAIPVCGSDGITYKTECDLKKASCKSQRQITLVRMGMCAPIVPSTTKIPCTKKCHFYAKCKVVRGAAKCVCPNLCPSIRLPVCGSDGVTYENQCDLKRASCKNQMRITVANVGKCAEPIPDPCSRGKCGFYATCEVHRGKATCVCPTNCPKDNKPVCGSDGRTYENACELKKTSCTNMKRISVVKVGVCDPIGTCPVPKICFTFCDQMQCSRKGKDYMCCCDGCGFACKRSYRDSITGRATCPADPLACRNDRDCTGGKLCCPHGCSKRCVAPRK